MDPHQFKEEIDCIFYFDILLVDSDNGHLRKPINHHKYTIISILGGRKARHVIHQHGLPRLLKSRKMGV
jgi:hypothetical protein